MANVKFTCFNLVKWTLLAVCMGLMSASILLAAMSEDIALTFANQYGHKKLVNLFVIIIAIITEMFALLGFVGAYKQNFWHTFIVAFFMSFNAMWTVFIATNQVFSDFWFFAILNLLVAALSHIFAAMLRSRLCERHNALEINPNFSFINFLNSAHNRATLNRNNNNNGDDASLPKYEPPPAYSEDLFKSITL